MATAETVPNLEPFEDDIRSSLSLRVMSTLFDLHCENPSAYQHLMAERWRATPSQVRNDATVQMPAEFRGNRRLRSAYYGDLMIASILEQLPKDQLPAQRIEGQLQLNV